MEESPSREASVELMGTADHTSCGVQHSFQFVGLRFGRTRQDSVTVVNVRVSVAADSESSERRDR